jgi:hypothetical protein
MIAALMGEPNPASPYYRALTATLAARGTSLTDLCPDGDVVARRVLHDYGAMFVGADNILPPPVCVCTSEEQVDRFQQAAGWTSANIEGATVELQPAAMAALLRARVTAHREGLEITPRDGAEAALAHWLSVGRLAQQQVDRLRTLPINQQVIEVLELETQGIFFSKDLSKSVLYSIAAPGTSQHMAMLAFDVNEFHNSRVREIMASEGWFQTVLSDLPHFTYLGLNESELPGRGLKAVEVNGQKFWIPEVA